MTSRSVSSGALAYVQNCSVVQNDSSYKHREALREKYEAAYQIVGRAKERACCHNLMRNFIYDHDTNKICLDPKP